MCIYGEHGNSVPVRGTVTRASPALLGSRRCQRSAAPSEVFGADLLHHSVSPFNPLRHLAAAAERLASLCCTVVYCCVTPFSNLCLQRLVQRDVHSCCLYYASRCCCCWRCEFVVRQCLPPVRTCMLYFSSCFCCCCLALTATLSSQHLFSCCCAALAALLWLHSG